MNDFQAMGEDRAVLRWGGLAGLAGGLLFILVFIIVGVFAGVDYASGAASAMKFPEIRAARTVENGLYLVVLVLWVTHYLALYRALRAASLAGALFGSFLSIVGLSVLAAGALPHVATLPISDLYHAPGASVQDQATLGMIWQATQGTFDAMLFAGLCVLPIGLIALGVAMRATPAFGKLLGGVTVGLGVLGVGAATGSLIDPSSPIAAIGVFALIIFHSVVGWRTYRLSL